jgi:predicted transposase YdaD
VQERGGPRPFDVATRAIIETDPAGWLAWIGLPADGPVRPIDSDVTSVLAAVDKVLRVDARPPWLAHLELQTTRDPALPARLLQYHAVLLHRHRIPVATTLVLLSPKAASRTLTGHFEQRGPDGEATVSFSYRVVRLWQRPVRELLQGGLGVLPLAPLAALRPEQLPAVLDHLDARFEREASSPSAVDELWAATLLLMGVRYDRDAILALGQRVQRMRESVTYQIILEEGEERGLERGLAQGEELGRAREARELLLELGTDKFGPPDVVTTRILGEIEDRATLELLIRGLFAASSWSELLAPIAR